MGTSCTLMGSLSGLSYQPTFHLAAAGHTSATYRFPNRDPQSSSIRLWSLLVYAALQAHSSEVQAAYKLQV